MFFTQNDKRSFHRMELELPIEITKGAVVIKGICKDLSSTGMSITFNDASLQAGDQVHIKLDTEDNRFPPLDADATLLRVDAQDIGFSAAVKFLSLK